MLALVLAVLASVVSVGRNTIYYRVTEAKDGHDIVSIDVASERTKRSVIRAIEGALRSEYGDMYRIPDNNTNSLGDYCLNVYKNDVRPLEAVFCVQVQVDKFTYEYANRFGKTLGATLVTA